MKVPPRSFSWNSGCSIVSSLRQSPVSRCHTSQKPGVLHRVWRQVCLMFCQKLQTPLQRPTKSFTESRQRGNVYIPHFSRLSNALGSATPQTYFQKGNHRSKTTLWKHPPSLASSKHQKKNSASTQDTFLECKKTRQKKNLHLYWRPSPTFLSPTTRWTVAFSSWSQSIQVEELRFLALFAPRELHGLHSGKMGGLGPHPGWGSFLWLLNGFPMSFLCFFNEFSVVFGGLQRSLDGFLFLKDFFGSSIFTETFCWPGSTLWCCWLGLYRMRFYIPSNCRCFLVVSKKQKSFQKAPVVGGSR